MKNSRIVILSLACGLFGQSAFADNSVWFGYVKNQVGYGTHLGKTASGKTCSGMVSPSHNSGETKDGLMVVLKQTKLSDIGGRHDKDIADINVFGSDTLVGSSRYPEGPFHNERITAFGYPKGNTSSAKALIVETLANGKVRITIETGERGSITSEYCTFDKR